MTANPSLTPRERLDAMVETLRRPMGAARVPSDLGVSTQDRDAIEAVALSLLEKCDALEARNKELEDHRAREFREHEVHRNWLQQELSKAVARAALRGGHQ